MADLVASLKAMTEWSRAVVFDSDCKVVASTFEAKPEEIKALTTAFDDYDTTVGNGLDLNGENYDVHRFYETLIYGRRGDSESGEGIAMWKGIGAVSKKPVFALITYGFPTLSARAVPQLRDFCKANVEPNL